MKTDNLITSKGAADILGVSTQRIYAMIKEKKLTPQIIGGIKFFDKAVINKFKKNV